MQRSPVPILRSKIRTPFLPQVCIARQAIEDRVLADQQDPSGRLIYLSAPPGYGKTTLLCRVARRFNGATAWISLDPLDNDPHRLTDHLLAALQLPSAGDEAAPDGADRLMTALNSIESLPEPVLLLFDDAHTLHNKTVFDALRTFLAYQPQNCRVAISSREDLPLPLHTHRQTDRLVELRAAELRASDDEARELLSRLGVELDPMALAGVLRKTDGWWSCLKLFAISWHQRRPEERLRFLERFRGTSRFIAEFLLESLVSALPPELTSAAATVAVPEFFNQSLYTRLTGRDDISDFLLQLQQLNIIALRPEEKTARYRFHPLLRDYLRHQLPRGRRAELHRHTASWFEEHGFSDRATRHVQLAEGLDRAAAGREARIVAPAAVADHGKVSISHREYQLLQTLSEGLSNDEIAARLFISTGTVKWHLNNIYGKLGARSRTDAVHKARAAGLLPS